MGTIITRYDDLGVFEEELDAPLDDAILDDSEVSKDPFELSTDVLSFETPRASLTGDHLKLITPYQVSGLVKTHGGIQGSGVLIHPQFVLTCYHILSQRKNGSLRRIRFTPCYDRSRKPPSKKAPYGTYDATEAFFPGPIRKYSNNNPYVSVDWCVLKLDRPFPIECPRLKVMSPKWTNTDWRVIGYPVKKKGKVQETNGIQIDQYSKHAYPLPSGKSFQGAIGWIEPSLPIGYSGGPFYIWRNHNNRFEMVVAGLQSHSGRLGSSIAAVTPAMINFVRTVITNHSPQ